MSSSRTGPTSTTASSSNWPSPADGPPDAPGSRESRDAHAGLPVVPGLESQAASADAARTSRRGQVALIACGAIAQPCKEIVDRRGWSVDVHPLPPLLHNRPEQIAGAVEALAGELRTRYASVAVGYADCGTYGALDEVCERLGLHRLTGLHCYDVYAGAERVQRFFDDQPGTYVLTDFLARSFARTVLTELGLDRYPELRDTYFGHYTRMIWLAQDPDEETTRLAEEAALSVGLPLTTLPVGTRGLEAELARLLGSSGRPASM